ncbi:MAG: dihydrofolate reductase [Deltaproteobacteria bacterium]|nr:MAG: dihydrofolate reductase [Deltaproteobacteria bacterium]
MSGQGEAPREPLALIVAVGRHRVIGKAGDLPWHLPEDLKHFKATTMGHALIMGRRTFDSIGRPLPGRRCIVVSRQADLAIPGAEVAHSLEAAIALARRTDPMPFVIGGGMLYEAALPLATHLYLTEVDRAVDGDTYFPEIDEGQWQERWRRSAETEGLVFRLLERRAG